MLIGSTSETGRAADAARAVRDNPYTSLHLDSDRLLFCSSLTSPADFRQPLSPSKSDISEPQSPKSDGHVAIKQEEKEAQELNRNGEAGISQWPPETRWASLTRAYRHAYLVPQHFGSCFLLVLC